MTLTTPVLAERKRLVGPGGGWHMVTFLAGGTGTPKLLPGADRLLDPETITVVGNTGDDVELGGLFVCPDVDTVLFERSGRLDRETWWGIADDTGHVHDELSALADAAGLDQEPHYLPDDRQTAGRPIARWRRFGAVPEFMFLGDRDRALHRLRTALLDEGYSLTSVTRLLADALGVQGQVLPMSDDPVASIIHTDRGRMHFQEFWVYYDGEPDVRAVEFKGADQAVVTESVRAAIREGPVVIGPSNPVTSLGPMLALDQLRRALRETPVVAVSPFVGDRVFSGPAADLMAGTGREPSTAGVAAAYPFADAFVLDHEDQTSLDRPVVRTDTTLADDADAERVFQSCLEALEVAA
jgi:LPPG:FO 2-phospho-L-lactate transferase